MELDTSDHRRSSGVTSGLHRMLTDFHQHAAFHYRFKDECLSTDF
ncbi:hypothetical protein [Rhizobium sp. 62_C5_N11_2]